MLAIAQNKMKVIEINEIILVTKGGPYSQEVEIRPIDSGSPIATYDNKKRAVEVVKEYLSARSHVYTLEHAKELLNESDIEKIIKNDYIFQFPEK